MADNSTILDSIAMPLWNKAEGELNQKALNTLAPDEITLLAYYTLREQLMEGGFVQLIQNGYGPFFFQNPFAKAMRLWGLHDFAKWMYKAQKLYEQTKDALEKPTDTEDEFMALYEQFPEWDEFDDEFIETEPEITALVCEAYQQATKS